MSDLKKAQEEFRNIRAFEHSNDGPYRESFENGFDVFRSSPEYLAMKEALEYYVNNWSSVPGAEVLSQLTESEGE